MDKEVELILAKLKIVSEEEERGLYLCDKEHSKILLDYITNLQEQLHQASLDIQELTEKDIGCPSWCDKLTNLQEKSNNQAEEINRLYKQREKFMKKYGYLKEEKDKYKNVIDKIKEYIPKLRRTTSYELDEKLDDILELLEKVE